MDVTTEINNKIQSMGGSGSSNLSYLSSNKSLLFAGGANNINSAPSQKVTAIPVLLNFSDSVGLFGSENRFIKIDLNIQSSTNVFANVEFPENTYFPVWTFGETDLINDFYTAKFDYLLDPATVNTYLPALVSGGLSEYSRPMVSIDLTNLKTGNKFIDAWFDVTLYGKDKQPVDGDYLYTDIISYFYIGFHARNTRRLAYNVDLKVGIEFLEYSSMTEAQRKLIR
jgi:hypothetical protein